MNEQFNNRQSELLILAGESILRGKNRYIVVRSLARKASDIYAMNSQKPFGELGSMAVKLAILAWSKDPF
ncbi:hypothetical protein [Gloeothece verrucosa]|uniref:Uncharacterized protein n=1 Tax=Gloeothece verrucosa (strain PCC 7822) TaxID=497965 RepID=E0UM33_GLOV7|nr:hypothetical protein [Gloeothece verrucosa]ADN18013.1 hypothetical protein Cyan7822_6192 [Gloeothece verrucosa PCC 7822]